MYRICHKTIGYIVEDNIETIQQARELKKHWGRNFEIENKYYDKLTVEKLYFYHSNLVPISARVNLYNNITKKLICSNYQNLKGNNIKYDNCIVKGYKYNSKSNLFSIWCQEV